MEDGFRRDAAEPGRRMIPATAAGAAARKLRLTQRRARILARLQSIDRRPDRWAETTRLLGCYQDLVAEARAIEKRWPTQRGGA